MQLAGLGGRALAAVTGDAPLYLALEGELGAGKTCWVRGMLRGLGYEGRVVSPTYTLMEPYQVGSLLVLHLDLYRLSDPAELEYLGLADQAGPGCIVCVEWPERAVGALPEPDLLLRFSYRGSGRCLRAQARSDAGCRWLAAMPEGTAAPGV